MSSVRSPGFKDLGVREPELRDFTHVAPAGADLPPTNGDWTHECRCQGHRPGGGARLALRPHRESVEESGVADRPRPDPRPRLRFLAQVPAGRAVLRGPPA